MGCRVWEFSLIPVLGWLIFEMGWRQSYKRLRCLQASREHLRVEFSLKTLWEVTNFRDHMQKPKTEGRLLLAAATARSQVPSQAGNAALGLGREEQWPSYPLTVCAPPWHADSPKSWHSTKNSRGKGNGGVDLIWLADVQPIFVSLPFPNRAWGKRGQKLSWDKIRTRGSLTSHGQAVI